MRLKDKKMKNAPHTLVGFMRIIGKTYKLLWNSSKKIMIASVLITIIGGIMIPLNSIIWGRFIDAVTGVLKGKDKIEAFKWLGLSVCVPLLIQVIGSMKNYLSYMEAGYMNRYITEIIINKIKRVRASAFDDNNFYNYVQKINNESVTRSLGIMRTSLKCIESIVFIISTIAIFVQFDLGIVIFCVLSCIPVLYININIVKKQYNVYNNRFEKLRYILSLKEIFTKYECVKELKVYRLHEFIGGKILKENDIFLKEDKKIRKKFTVENIVADAIKSILSGVLKILILYKTILNGLLIGQFVTFVQLIEQLQTNISILFNVVQSFFEDGLYIEDLYRFLNNKSIEESIVTGQAMNKIETIEFKSVSFKYPGIDKWILKDLNICLCQGESYAIVGINGAGKTTFIKLILGLYEPTKGEILVNGINLKEIDKNCYFSMFATVFQDFVKYPFTVYENIGIGNINDIDKQNNIEEAAKLSDIDSIIQKLPYKYGTQLQREWKEAVDLSHGQWQRIALSRAFFNKLAQVVILDEPSSALDPEAEFVILKKMEKIAESKMQIIISHRLSNIKKASCIIVLKDGKIIDKDNHQKLYERNKEYRKMYEMQAMGYND